MSLKLPLKAPNNVFDFLSVYASGCDATSSKDLKWNISNLLFDNDVGVVVVWIVDTNWIAFMRKF